MWNSHMNRCFNDHLGQQNQRNNVISSPILSSLEKILYRKVLVVNQTDTTVKVKIVGNNKEGLCEGSGILTFKEVEPFQSVVFGVGASNYRSCTFTNIIINNKWFSVPNDQKQQSLPSFEVYLKKNNQGSVVPQIWWYYSNQQFQ